MDQRRRTGGLIVIAIVGTACDGGTDDAPIEAAALVDHMLWTLAPSADDPFAARRPADAVCDPQGVRPEWLGPDPILEVDTGACDHVTVVQPSLADLAADAAIDVRLWHYDLVAADPGAAYAAISIAGEIVWEYETAIPADSMLVHEIVVSTEGAPVGTPVYFFIGNHGTNQWGLIDIERVGDDERD